MNNPDGKIIIETEINTTKFDKQIGYLDEKSRKLEVEIEKQKKVNVDTSEAEAELEKIRNKINSLSDKSIKVGLEAVSNIEFSSETIKNLGSTSLQFEGINGNITKINGNLDYASSNIKEMKQDVRHLNEEIDEQPTRFLKISEGFKKALKQVKKYGLALLGIRTAYSLVSKATSAYLDANEETANKLQSIWKVLGEAIGPVIDWIANSILKLIGYINEFVKAFTGGKVDLVAQANARAIANQTKAQEKLNKATQNYDFDVVRTQQDTTSSSTSSTSGLIEIPELNMTIVEKLRDMGEVLKDNWYWIKQVGTILGIVFGAKAIGSLLVNIGNLIANKTSGLTGLLTGLKTVAVVWAITVIVDGVANVIEKVSEINDIMTDAVNKWKILTEASQENTKSLDNMLEAGEDVIEQLDEIRRYNDELAERTTYYANQTHWYQRWFGQGNKYKEIIEEQVKQTIEQTKQMEKLYNFGKITEDEYIKYIKETLPKFREAANKAGVDVQSLNETIANLPKAHEILLSVDTKEAEENVENIDNNVKNLPATKEINVEVTATDKTQSVLDKIKSGFASIGSSINSLFTGNTKTKGYALGGIVTQPTRALIGEAGYNEYVLPEREDYLSRLASLIGQYSGGSGRATNVYLNGRLIQREMEKEENDRNFARNR